MGVSKTYRSVFLLIALLAYCYSPAMADVPHTSHTSEQTEFPFSISPGKDITLSALSLSLSVTGALLAFNTDGITEPQVANLDMNSVNRFDRSAVNHWSPNAATISDVALITSATVPLIFMLHKFTTHKKRVGLTLLLMYLEAMGINFGITSIVKKVVRRERPFLYNDSLSAERRAKESHSRESFFSGHTSISFCSATFLSKVFFEMHPLSPWRFAILSGSLTLASTTALLRYTAGKHFPTDIFTGAAVGALIGYLIPALHKNKARRIVMYPLNGNIKGVGAGITF